jgi:hypothetical protein
MTSARPWPDAFRVAAGGLVFDVAPEGVRHLTVGGHEVFSTLYAAVRARNWATLPFRTVSQDLQIDDHGCSLTREEIVDERLQSRMVVSWADSGVLAATVEMVALEDVDVNRWGYNVCLDARLWVGADVLSAGAGARFPRRIAPQRAHQGVLQGLFPPADRLSLRRPDGMIVHVESEGQLLEVEDQRNWTDPTFKIYSGSLRDPLPRHIGAGSVVRQSVRIAVTDLPSRPVPVAQEPVVGPAIELVRVGVQVNDADPSRNADATARLLAALRVDHLRVDVEPPLDVPFHPEGAAADVPVELAVLVPDLTSEVLSEVTRAAGSLPQRSRVLLHLTGRRTTDAAGALALTALLAPSRPDLVVVPGSDAYFADLNRDEPRCRDLVSFSITPTVHATDTETVFATLPLQAEVARHVREVLGARAVVSPVTLRLRGDPESPSAPASVRREIAEQHLDERLDRIEGAAWTFGSVHALTEGGAFAGTWYELLGVRGVARIESEEVRVAPAFHALSVLRANDRPRVRSVTALEGGVVGLIFVDQHRMVLASQRPWEQHLSLAGWSAPCARRRRLRATDVATAASTPAWWNEAEHVPLDPRQDLVLAPFELTELLES